MIDKNKASQVVLRMFFPKLGKTTSVRLLPVVKCSPAQQAGTSTHQKLC